MDPALPARVQPSAGCLWLPRFLAEGRLLLADHLPPDYVERFGHPDGVDGYFFRFFGLTHDQRMDAFRRYPDDGSFAAWFLALPGIDAERVAVWNHFAEQLGQPGRPMVDRLTEVLPRMAGSFDTARVRSIFDLLTAGEAHP